MFADVVVEEMMIVEDNNVRTAGGGEHEIVRTDRSGKLMEIGRHDNTFLCPFGFGTHLR